MPSKVDRKNSEVLMAESSTSFPYGAVFIPPSDRAMKSSGLETPWVERLRAAQRLKCALGHFVPHADDDDDDYARAQISVWLAVHGHGAISSHFCADLETCSDPCVVGDATKLIALSAECDGWVFFERSDPDGTGIDDVPWFVPTQFWQRFVFDVMADREAHLYRIDDFDAYAEWLRQCIELDSLSYFIQRAEIGDLAYRRSLRMLFRASANTRALIDEADEEYDAT